jgi:transcriptional regulator with XRE-family HTH domain
MTQTEFHEMVGNRIRQVRMSKNVSQVMLADLCDSDKSNMSRIEKGQVNITLSTLYKIAKVLDVPAFHLLMPHR